MKFTIITATFNSEKIIASNIASVLGQTYGNFEQIIVDNASSDRTLAIIKDLYGTSAYKNNLKIISEKDRGISDAFNKGLAAATGDVIIILSSDDYLLSSDILQKVKLEIDKGAELVHGDVKYIDEKFGTQLRKPLLCPIEIAMPFNHPAMFIKKDVYQKFGFFNEHYRYAMDYEHTSRFYHSVTETKCRITYVPEALVALRAGGESCRHEKKSIIETKKFLQEIGLWNFRAKKNYVLRLVRVEMKTIILAIRADFIVSAWRKLKWG